ncbi:hypothetical protein PR048_032691 [Dryococelus australis]|uniref:Uncharacterized protein n=1 Tax=Dryococelus australis TaxID=614101 RepID=A0ABQ9G2W9_9NEOP|nr:hypothetical protein PR048_032691 [Dryococelus australis]
MRSLNGISLPSNAKKTGKILITFLLPYASLSRTVIIIRKMLRVKRIRCCTIRLFMVSKKPCYNYKTAHWKRQQHNRCTSYTIKGNTSNVDDVRQFMDPRHAQHTRKKCLKCDVLMVEHIELDNSQENCDSVNVALHAVKVRGQVKSGLKAV